MKDIAASVLAKLKNRAKQSSISYQQCLQLFFQEEFLRKLSMSKYKENFILKGGLFIYTLTEFESRATVDVDFLVRGVSNDMKRVDEIIDEILSVPTGNDYIKFVAKSAELTALLRLQWLRQPGTVFFKVIAVSRHCSIPHTRRLGFRSSFCFRPDRNKTDPSLLHTAPPVHSKPCAHRSGR